MPYSRTLRRRVRSPYLDIIRAQAPYARQAARDEDTRALTEEGLGLQREGLVQRGQEARDRLALETQGMELSAEQAKKAQQIQMAGTGIAGVYTGYKVGEGLDLWGGDKPTPGTTTTDVPSVGSGITPPSVEPSTLTPKPGYGEYGGSPTGEGAYDYSSVTPGVGGATGGGATALPGGAAGEAISVGGSAIGPNTSAKMGGGGTGGMGAGGYLAAAGQAYGLYGDMSRPKSSYKEGSKGKYGRGMGRAAGSIVAGYYSGGNPWAITAGGEAGAYLGERTWPSMMRVVEAGDDVAEALWKRKVHGAGEIAGERIADLNLGDPLTKGVAKGVGKVVEEGTRPVQQTIDFFDDLF